MKPNDLIDVTCPLCNETRKLKWSAYKNKSAGPPYVQQCRCWQKGKTISQEQKEKISKKLTGRSLSQETKDKIAEYRKDHPELWETLQPELGRGKRFLPHSLETKQKISDAMKKNIQNKKKKTNE